MFYASNCNINYEQKPFETSFTIFVYVFFQIRGFTSILPKNIHLLTVEPVSEYQFLLRLEHFYERGDDPVLSLPVKISLEVC